MATFLQYMYKGGLGTSVKVLGRSNDIPEALEKIAHPQSNNFGLEDRPNWSTYQWAKKGGYSIFSHQEQEQDWIGISKIIVYEDPKAGKIPLVHTLFTKDFDPLLIQQIHKALVPKPTEHKNKPLKPITLKPKDGALTKNWIPQVTPILRCILSGVPLHWVDPTISAQEAFSLLQLVLLSLPEAMQYSLAVQLCSYTLRKDIAFGHGQYSKQGAVYKKGALQKTKSLKLQDCTGYLSLLKRVKATSLKQLKKQVAEMFSDLPPSFSSFAWSDQGTFLQARLEEKKYFATLKKTLPKKPSEDKILSLKGMRSEALGLLLKYKKLPWVFPLLERTGAWKIAWLDHGIYGFLFGMLPPKNTKMFQSFVGTNLPEILIKKAEEALSMWVEEVDPEIWLVVHKYPGSAWWESWKNNQDITLFWLSLNPKKPEEWDHPLYEHLQEQLWRKKEITRLIHGLPTSLEETFRILIEQLLKIIPLQAIRILEDGMRYGYSYNRLWKQLNSPTLALWKKGHDVQKALSTSEDTLSELEVRIILTFADKKFARKDEISPHLGALAMQYFFDGRHLKSKEWKELAETVIKQKMIWDPDAYFIHSTIPGLIELYLEAINEAKTLPAGGAAALLWMLLKGQNIDDSISIPDGFIDLCLHLSYPIALSQVQASGVLYALILHRNATQRDACSLEQIQKMLFWYVQQKRRDAPLQWISESIWRFFPLLHDHLEPEYPIRPDEEEFCSSLHPNLIRRFASLGVVFNAEILTKIKFRTTHRQRHLQRFAHVIIKSKAKKSAINLGVCLWARLSEDNRIKLQKRISSKTVWWRRIIRWLVRSQVLPLELRKRSEILEGLCIEFNCLSEIVLAAQTELGNEETDT